MTAESSGSPRSFPSYTQSSRNLIIIRDKNNSVGSSGPRPGSGILALPQCFPFIYPFFPWSVPWSGNLVILFHIDLSLKRRAGAATAEPIRGSRLSITSSLHPQLHSNINQSVSRDREAVLGAPKAASGDPGSLINFNKLLEESSF